MFTTYAASKILLASLGKSNTASIAPYCYLGFSTTTPSVDGTNVTEPSGSNYERILIGYSGQSATYLMGTPEANAAGTQVSISNTSTIKSNRASGNWGTITHVCIFDSATGGNLIAFEALDTSVSVTTGSSIHFNTGELTFTLK